MKIKKENARRWIFENAKGHCGKVILLSVACMINAAIGIVLALTLKKIVDSAVNGEMTAFIKAAIITALLIFTQLSIGYCIRAFDERTRADIENTLKNKLFLKIITRDYGILEQYHTGELMNRLSNDVKVVGDNIVALMPNIISMITRLFCAMVLLLCLDWRFATIFFVGGFFVMAVSMLFRKKVKSLHKKMQEAEGNVRSFQQEMLENIIVVRSFQAEQKIEEMGWQYMQEHKKMRLKKNTFSNVTQTGFSVIMNVGYLFGILWCGMGILNHTLSYGTLLAVQQLIGQVQQPIAGMAGIIPRYYTMIASAERLMELEGLREDCKTQKQERQKKSDFYQLQIEHLTTGYKEEKGTVLEDVSLTIHQGDSIAITGESGCGKSTLLKSLLCLYPRSAGSMILVDKNGKKESFDGTKRFYFGYVPQGNFLISGTIKDVITLYGEQGCHDIAYACKIACADGFIEQLPQKYDTKIGERGVGLSEGQMQRLAIARAVYFGAPVLLLDEATSALDAATELQVLKNLKSIPNQTLCMVTHRPAAFQICNRVIEVKDKKIKER